MSDANPSVLIIDDDPEFRDSVARLLQSVGLHTQQFSSVSDFFNAPPPNGPTCLVLDIRMPGRSGLELQRDLAAANRQLPIIFITAHGDIPMTVQAMKGGAIEFLTKQFRDQVLLEAVQAGLARRIGEAERAWRQDPRAATVKALRDSIAQAAVVVALDAWFTSRTKDQPGTLAAPGRVPLLPRIFEAVMTKSTEFGVGVAGSAILLLLAGAGR